MTKQFKNIYNCNEYYLTKKGCVSDITNGFAQILNIKSSNLIYVRFIPTSAELFTMEFEEDDPETWITPETEHLIAKSITKDDFEKAVQIVEEAREKIYNIIYSTGNAEDIDLSALKVNDLILDEEGEELFRIDSINPLSFSLIASFDEYIRIFENFEIEKGEYDEDSVNYTIEHAKPVPQSFYDNILKIREDTYSKLTLFYNELLNN